MDNISVASSYIGSSPKLDPNHLKAIISAKDACLFNFSKTLRMADEKAKITEAALNRRIQELENELQKKNEGSTIKVLHSTPDKLTAELVRLQKELAADREDLNALRNVHDENLKVSAMKEANYQKLVEKLEGEVQHAIQQQRAAEQGLKIKSQDFEDRSNVLENELFQLRNKMLQETESIRQRLAQSQKENAELRSTAESSPSHRDYEAEIASLRSDLALAKSQRARAEEQQQQLERRCDALATLADDLRTENHRLQQSVQELNQALNQARLQSSDRDAVEIENQELRAACGALQERVRAQGEELERLGSREERGRREALERSAFLERSLRSTQEELQVKKGPGILLWLLGFKLIARDGRVAKGAATSS